MSATAAPEIDTANLKPMLTVSEVKRLLNCPPDAIYAHARTYIERIRATEHRTGRRIDHDSDEALPRDGEIPAVRLSEPTRGRDGKRRGGMVRIYRDLLLWKLYGVRDYGYGGEA